MFKLSEFEKYLKNVGMHCIEEIYIGNNQKNISFMYGYDRCTFLYSKDNDEEYSIVLRIHNDNCAFLHSEDKKKEIEEVSSLISLYFGETPICFYTDHTTKFVGMSENVEKEIREPKLYSVIEWRTHDSKKRMEYLTSINDMVSNGCGITDLQLYEKNKNKVKEKGTFYCGKLQ